MCDDLIAFLLSQVHGRIGLREQNFWIGALFRRGGGDSDTRSGYDIPVPDGYRFSQGD